MDRIEVTFVNERLVRKFLECEESAIVSIVHSNGKTIVTMSDCEEERVYIRYTVFAHIDDVDYAELAGILASSVDVPASVN